MESRRHRRKRCRALEQSSVARRTLCIGQGRPGAVDERHEPVLLDGLTAWGGLRPAKLLCARDLHAATTPATGRRTCRRAFVTVACSDNGDADQRDHSYNGRGREDGLSHWLTYWDLPFSHDNLQVVSRHSANRARRGMDGVVGLTDADCPHRSPRRRCGDLSSGSVNLYGCTIGATTKIGAFVEIQRGAIIGRRCKISSHTLVCEGVTIEDDVFVGHGVVFINDPHPRATTDGRRRTRRTGPSCAPTSAVGRRSEAGRRSCAGSPSVKARWSEQAPS